MLGQAFTRRRPPGLGVLMNGRGLAMVESKGQSATLKEDMAWHWQPWEESPGSGVSTQAWPDPKWVKQVKRRCGFQARLLAMAIPEEHLKSFQLQLDGGVAPAELKAQLKERLQDLLPWPLADTLWDFQATATAEVQASASPNSRPAWLNQAMKQQPAHNIEIVAMPREWAGQCEHWSQQAGLQLVRLEPAWQASQRWQTYLNNDSAGLLQEPPAVYQSGMRPVEQAVAGGLALGVAQP